MTALNPAVLVNCHGIKFLLQSHASQNMRTYLPTRYIDSNFLDQQLEALARETTANQVASDKLVNC